MSYVIRDFRAGDENRVERILRALPGWFGIESSLVQYVEDSMALTSWIAEAPNDDAVGCLTLRLHNPQSAEIHLMAVHPDHHRRGIGRLLVEFLEDHLKSRAVLYLQVKTLGPSRPSAEYEMTRKFYHAMEFAALEEFPTLWPGNPCLLMVKKL